jgi:glycosyltransferase involved in cell wall biosynthesis
MMAHSCGVPAAVFKLFARRPRFVLTLQEGDPPEHIKKVARPVWPLFKRAFSSADVVQAISSFLAEFATSMGHLKEPVVIPNGVDIAHFGKEHDDEDVAAALAVLGEKASNRYLITTSRLVPKNAVDVVIRSLAFLPENVVFLVLGIGPQEAELRTLATDEGVANRVRFLGQVDHAVLPTYLSLSDVFVRPSRSEGMGNSFLEAMAAGVPVVGTQFGGIADFLFDPDLNPNTEPTGFAVAPDDPIQLAEKISRALTDELLTDSIMHNARELVVKEYDWDLIAPEMRRRVFGCS